MCSTTNGIVSAAVCTPLSSTASVRCCNAAGSACISNPSGQCLNAATYAEAEAACSAAGYRLCTESEVSLCCGTGCAHDDRQVWTSTAESCSSQPTDAAGGGAGAAPAAPLPRPRQAGRVPLIIDTDMSIDVDDVGALCVAHALADLGEVDIRAIVHDTGYSAGVGAVAILNEYYGRPDIRLGAYRGRVGVPSLTPGGDIHWTHRGKGVYIERLLSAFPSSLPWRTVSDAWQVEDALAVYRSEVRPIPAASPPALS